MSILVDERTTFIIYGITGREAVNMTRECLDYGSQFLGGLTPGREVLALDAPPMYRLVNNRDARPTLVTTSAGLGFYAFTFVSCLAGPPLHLT